MIKDAIRVAVFVGKADTGVDGIAVDEIAAVAVDGIGTGFGETGLGA